MKIVLIGNYEPDRQESMQRFADLLFDRLQTMGVSVEMVKPPVCFGRFPAQLRQLYPGLGSAFREIHRVLKPGGWFCARTSIIRYYSYALHRCVGFGRWGKDLLKRTQPNRDERDAFPVFYRTNSVPVLKALLRKHGFEVPFVTSWEPEPGYLNFHPLALAVEAMYQRAAMIGILLRSTLMVFAKK